MKLSAIAAVAALLSFTAATPAFAETHGTEIIGQAPKASYTCSTKKESPKLNQQDAKKAYNSAPKSGTFEVDPGFAEQLSCSGHVVTIGANEGKQENSVDYADLRYAIGQLIKKCPRGGRADLTKSKYAAFLSYQKRSC